MKGRNKGITRHRLNQIRNQNTKRERKERIEVHNIDEYRSIYQPLKKIDDYDLRDLIGAQQGITVTDPDPIRTYLDGRFGKFKKFVDNTFYERMKMLYNFKMDEIAEAAFQQKYRECRKMKKKRSV